MTAANAAVPALVSAAARRPDVRADGRGAAGQDRERPAAAATARRRRAGCGSRRCRRCTRRRRSPRAAYGRSVAGSARPRAVCRARPARIPPLSGSPGGPPPQCPVHLPLHGVGECGDDVGVRAGVDGAFPAVTPGAGRVEAEPEEEEQPAHRGLGHDPYDRTFRHAHGADPTARPQQPVPVPAWIGGRALEDAGGGEGLSGFGAQGD